MRLIKRIDMELLPSFCCHVVAILLFSLYMISTKSRIKSRITNVNNIGGLFMMWKYSQRVVKCFQKVKTMKENKIIK